MKRILRTGTTAVTAASGVYSEEMGFASRWSSKDWNIQRVVVKATTSSTIFDVALTDRDGFVLGCWKSIYGQLNESTSLCVDDDYLTVEITNSTKDEDFAIKIVAV